MAGSKQNTTAIVLIVGLIVAGGVFFAVRASRRQSKNVEEALRSSPVIGGGSTSEVINPKYPAGAIFSDYNFTAFPIKWRDSNEDVRQLQLLLLKFDKNILKPYGADGKFGSVTESALKKVLGKNKVESQADISKINQAIANKANALTRQAAINLTLGIPVYK